MTTTSSGRRAITTKAALWSIRRPWSAIGLWVVFVVMAALLGGMTETKQATDADLGVGEAGRAEQLVEDADFADPPTDNVLITPNGSWNEEIVQSAIVDVEQRLEELPEVADVGAAVESQRAQAWLVPITLSGTDDDAADHVGVVTATVSELAADHDGLRVETVGPSSISTSVNDLVNEDLASAATLSLPVTLVILLVVFGALVAAGVPLLLGFSAVVAATGLWTFASQVVPDIGSVPQVILLLGLAVGVDYSLFYLKREREERARGHGTVDAVSVAAATSGRAVVTSAMTSIVALAGLYLSGDAIFRALGTGVILVIAVAMLGSLTVLPALLVKLGRAMDRPRIPLLRRQAHAGEPRVWRILLRPALRAPKGTIVIVIAGLAALSLPALGMNLANSSEEDIPQAIPVMQSYDRMVEAFPSEGGVHQVVVHASAAQSDTVREALVELHGRAADRPMLAPSAEPAIRTSDDGTVHTLQLGYPYDTGTPEAEESLATLRTDLVPAALAPVMSAVPDAEYAVGGNTAFNLDYTDQQVDRLPWIVGFVVLLTVTMMALAFRSVVVALIAGALAVLSVGAAFGVLTSVFQNTWAEGPLNFTSSGYLVNWVPLFLFVVLLGLSMDYHVFVVSRIREAAEEGLATSAAVRKGMMQSAGVVTSAAAIMVAVFSIFATMSFLEMKQLGVGLAVAIAIDATVVRLLLLPSIMIVLGSANWWPSRLSTGSRRLPPQDASFDGDGDRRRAGRDSELGVNVGEV